MKDLLYLLISVLIIACFIALQNKDKKLESKEFNGSIVIEKTDDLIFGYTMFFMYNKDSIEIERVYQIFYDKYKVGDTILINN